MAVKKILLVEDDLDIRENTAMILKYEGYDVIEAEHGLEALKKLEAITDEFPVAILLDLFMPIMNGREFLDALSSHSRTELKNIPVILITASEQNVREDLDDRTMSVLRKPINLKEFLRLVSTIVTK